MKCATILMAAVAAAAWGQSIKLPDSVERLRTVAEESVEITMDKSMLRLAGKFLSDHGEEAKARKTIDGLDSIYVRSFTFGREGAYSAADVEAVRAQFRTAAWSRIVGVKSREEGDVDVFLKSGSGGQLGGAVVIAAGPRELTIVHINGTLDPDQLADLGGQFHIPHLAMRQGARR
uniref:DUF4252 domain-containing protein n=1 Tax=Solibacter usitatus (strain Ellin6076) TaxID=234267 RepID=Q020H4_SOLUE